MRRVILNFHGIGTPGRMLEEGEAPYWVTPEFYEEVLGLAAKLRDRVETSFTFDDGNLSDLAIGAEGLARHGFSAQFFVLSSRIGQGGSLGADDIRKLQAMGHGIGSHGADHVSWKGLGEAGLVRELDTARDSIAEVTGQRPDAAAIPFGRYDARALRALRQRGYTRAYSSDGGAWRSGQFPIPRTSPTARMSVSDVESILLGHEPLKRRLRRVLSMAVKKRV